MVGEKKEIINYSSEI